MGFSGLDHLLRAQTVLDDLEAWDFAKTPVTAGLLVASRYYDFYEAGPDPAANTFPVGSTAFKAVRGNAGVPQAGGVNINAIAMQDPTGGKTRHLTYLEHQGGSTTFCVGDWYVLDLLGFYCDFNLAVGGTQATGTGVGVADITRYTNGQNVFMYVVAQVAFTGTAPTIMLNYTNQALGSSSTAALAMINTSPRGQIVTTTFFKVPLAAGDSGAVALRSVTFAGGAAPTGKVAVMFARQRGKMTHSVAQQGQSKSFIDPRAEFSAPQFVADSVPAFVFKAANTPSSPSIAGQFQTTKGYAT